ncbi:platelet glycoprotein Ib beta chain [Tachyglossus aculeatus]|uniref:platelet glycoprotein Ib beta chain n=1 Tax=Tachyglossus aculeatus TaxID=9261 RepID=UPI0018F5F376|nr:platelet glycoprotein Ib beta chain [Tachyglossus aculeatus]
MGPRSPPAHPTPGPGARIRCRGPRLGRGAGLDVLRAPHIHTRPTRKSLPRTRRPEPSAPDGSRRAQCPHGARPGGHPEFQTPVGPPSLPTTMPYHTDTGRHICRQAPPIHALRAVRLTSHQRHTGLPVPASGHTRLTLPGPLCMPPPRVAPIFLAGAASPPWKRFQVVAEDVPHLGMRSRLGLWSVRSPPGGFLLSVMSDDTRSSPWAPWPHGPRSRLPVSGPRTPASRALGPLLLACWALLPAGLSACPARCRCAGTIVDCGRLGLTADLLPAAFPPATTEIVLSANNLSAVPEGLFDGLTALRAVHLAGNPWRCDCDVLYLRAWLRWQQQRDSYRELRCASPPGLRGRLLAYLSEDELFSSCQAWYCRWALGAQLCLLIFLLLQALLLLLVILRLRRFQAVAREARRTAQELLQTVPLVPLEPDAPST